MGKRSKLWLALLAVVMVLGQCLTASAATSLHFSMIALTITGSN